jgi:Lar family restriction alleviation protein
MDRRARFAASREGSRVDSPKPCPFCGGVPQLDKSKLTGAVRYECSECGAHRSCIAVSPSDAVEHWNHRAPIAGVPGMDGGQTK